MYYAMIELTDEAYKDLVNKKMKLAGTLCMNNASMGYFNAWRRRKPAGEERRLRLTHGSVTITDDHTRLRMKFLHSESVSWRQMCDEMDRSLEYIWKGRA